MALALSSGSTGSFMDVDDASSFLGQVTLLSGNEAGANGTLVEEDIAAATSAAASHYHQQPPPLPVAKDHKYGGIGEAGLPKLSAEQKVEELLGLLARVQGKYEDKLEEAQGEIKELERLLRIAKQDEWVNRKRVNRHIAMEREERSKRESIQLDFDCLLGSGLIPGPVPTPTPGSEEDEDTIVDLPSFTEEDFMEALGRKVFNTFECSEHPFFKDPFNYALFGGSAPLPAAAAIVEKLETENARLKAENAKLRTSRGNVGDLIRDKASALSRCAGMKRRLDSIGDFLNLLDNGDVHMSAVVEHARSVVPKKRSLAPSSSKK